ncbi:MAG: pyrroloquinoline quinone-dependent dehydrogenase [Armatimonadetes bacterium]|nr:pyrroloquinoline quinone-dependent dehydrogenase [Armatimonadota bacterium]
MRYSKLTQINRSNVKKLKVAWTYHTGEKLDPGSTIECTPVVVDGVMYITTAKIHVVALDAATGKRKWEYTPPKTGRVNRGVAYWTDGKAKRVLIGTVKGQLISLDAKTGLPDPNFGDNGIADTRIGLDRDVSAFDYDITSAVAVYKDLVVTSIVSSEGQPGAPGDVRAFDVRTGKEVWAFHTVPRPGEVGNDTWEGDSWRDRSGTNPWPGYTVDTKNGLLFCGVGSATSDFYGADRGGANLFANCTLALDAATGQRRWHFQTVHHDLWDHDNPCPPVLCTITRNGKKLDVAVQPTKTGFLYVFDRLTGKPVYDVKEVPAPASSVPGEKAWPTQPEPIKPPRLEPAGITADDLTNVTPEKAAYVRNWVKSLRLGRAYEPPSLEGTVVNPGYHGGATWSGASVDPTTGILYINTNNVPAVQKLVANGNGGYDFAGYTFFFDQDGHPANKPPWSHLTAVDLGKGTFVWRKVFGEHPELKAKGIPPTGCQNFGGTIVTAGGLVFIGATQDEKFHAYDKATGKLLWQHKLPAGGYATPCTYSVKGRQYVVIAAGGGGKLGTKSGDAFVAYALGAK